MLPVLDERLGVAQSKGSGLRQLRVITRNPEEGRRDSKGPHERLNGRTAGGKLKYRQNGG